MKKPNAPQRYGIVLKKKVTRVKISKNPSPPNIMNVYRYEKRCRKGTALFSNPQVYYLISFALFIK